MGEYSTQRMVVALEERLAIERARFKALQTEYLKLKADAPRWKRAYDIWIALQNHVRDNETIRDAWNEFYTYYTLAIENQEELKSEYE